MAAGNEPDLIAENERLTELNRQFGLTIFDKQLELDHAYVAIVELAAALRPFGCKHFALCYPDTEKVGGQVFRVGDFRRARSAVKAVTPLSKVAAGAVELHAAHSEGK